MMPSNSDRMAEVDRPRAPRNRTLTLSDSDRDQLSQELRRHDEMTRSLSQRVLCGPFQERLADIEPGSIDLLFLDPPYNLSKSFNGRRFVRRPEDDYTGWLKQVVESLLPKLKPTATCYVCGDWRTSHSIYQAVAPLLQVRNRVTWERDKGRGAKSNWKNNSEDIWFCTVSSHYTFNAEAVKMRRRVVAPYVDQDGVPKDWIRGTDGNYRDTHASNLWTDISIPFWSMRENTDHPTQKSEKLLAKLILASTHADDLVLDPFMGSGTALVASKKLHRRAIGCEIDNEYCLLALKRLQNAEHHPEIQGYEDGVFWERNSTRPSKYR